MFLCCEKSRIVVLRIEHDEGELSRSVCTKLKLNIYDDVKQSWVKLEVCIIRRGLRCYDQNKGLFWRIKQSFRDLDCSVWG